MRATHGLKEEIKVFLTAVMFYTRIPCPSWMDYSEDKLNKASRYFPLIGWIVGIAAGAVFWAANPYFGKEVAIILSLLASIWVTGAFHEDGLADVCDAFGGGWTKNKILEIMKDSRIGTFGTVGLVLALGLKFFTLLQIPASLLPAALVIAHSLSRTAAISMVFFYNYVSDPDQSKAKPVGKRSGGHNLIIILILGCLPLLILPDWRVWTVLPVLFMATWRLGAYYKKWIGGYTGDCLGAAQQVNEILLYLVLLAIFS